MFSLVLSSSSKQGLVASRTVLLYCTLSSALLVNSHGQPRPVHDIVYSGHPGSSRSSALYCPLYYLFLQACSILSPYVTGESQLSFFNDASNPRCTPGFFKIHAFVFLVVYETRNTRFRHFISKALTLITFLQSLTHFSSKSSTSTVRPNHFSSKSNSRNHKWPQWPHKGLHNTDIGASINAVDTGTNVKDPCLTG